MSPVERRPLGPPSLSPPRSQGKLELAGEVLEEEPGGADFPHRLARLMRDAGVTPPTVTIEYRGLGVVRAAAACWSPAALGTRPHCPCGPA